MKKVIFAGRPTILKIIFTKFRQKLTITTRVKDRLLDTSELT